MNLSKGWRYRVVAGFLLAPVLPAFYTVILYGQPWAFPVGLALAYPSALVIGLPAFLVLHHYRREGWSTLATCGAFCAVPSLLIYWRVHTPDHFEPFNWDNSVYLVAWGIVSGLVFWLIVSAGEADGTL